MSDFDRPLNERGKRDAPDMAARLLQKGVKIDRFVSSPAKRAKRTARYFAEAYGKEKGDILLIEPLYLAPPEVFRNVVKALPAEADTAALFAHNPGITEYANTLTGVRIDDMPTCAVIAVSADTDSWEGFGAAEKTFLFFDYPKNSLG
jgi:phosphohistidine phosphatase